MIAPKILLNIHELFRYEDGHLFWKVRPGGGHIGDEAGSTDTQGYHQIGYQYKLYKRHRIIYAMFTGEWPKLIDHIDQNKSNDRIENLRPSTEIANGHNSDLSWGKVPHRGVGYHKRDGVFYARIMINSKRVSLGNYPSEQEAIDAYQKYKQIHTTHLM